MPEYLLVNLAVIAIPLAFSWHPRLRFVDRWRDFFPGCLIVLAVFVIWDILFVRRSVWGFESDYLVGLDIAGLPIEEWLFFVCIPYACVFTYHALGRLGIGDGLRPFASALSLSLLATCAVLAAMYTDRLYTAVTCVATALFLVGLLAVQPCWRGRFWTSYLILLVPFVATNGFLTGRRFWAHPLLNAVPDGVTDRIVWYDNTQNLATRLFSIPLDDFLYAFLLIGMNVAVFEFLGTRRRAD